MSDKKDVAESETEELVEGEGELLRDLAKGLLAGVIAAAAVAVLIAIQKAMGLVPQLDIIGIMAWLTGLTFSGAGWIVLFAFGALWGMGFSSLDSHVGHVTGAGEIVHGIIFAVVAWAVLSILALEFYTQPGIVTTPYLATILLGCLVFGAVTGGVYGALQPEEVPES